MAEFATFYIQFLADLFTNIGMFFKKRFQAVVDIFAVDIPRYNSNFISSAEQFDVGGWIVFVLTLLLSLTCLFFIFFRVGQLIRRFVVFRAKEVEKDQLLEELAKAKNTITRLTIEKNQIYAMKVNSMFGGTALPEANQEKPQETKESESTSTDTTGLALPKVKSRFTRLTSIDKKYEYAVPFVSTAEAEQVTLEQIIDNFINYAASQRSLYYSKKTLREFFAGMATTKVIILEGISGTGKTSLPMAIGKFFDHPTGIVSVQPAWRDRADLLGYLNEFSKTYNETDFLVNLYEATYCEEPSFIILDEMNLARIEYYFAEFLSVMELKDPTLWKIETVAAPDPNDPKNIEDGKITIPQNLWFIGTANNDDSTFTITDKVYDRAITIDLNNRFDYFDAPLTDIMHVSADYLQLLFDRAKQTYAISEKNLANLSVIDKFLTEKFKITFGNRIMKQIADFVPVYMATGGDEIEAIDFLIMTKILRKMSNLNLLSLRKELEGLIALLNKTFGRGKCVDSIAYINELIMKA